MDQIIQYGLIGIGLLLTVLVWILIGLPRFWEKLFGQVLVTIKEVRGSVADPSSYTGIRLSGQFERGEYLNINNENPDLTLANIYVSGETEPEQVVMKDVQPRDKLLAMAHSNQDVWYNINAFKDSVVREAKTNEEMALRETQTMRMHTDALYKENEELLSERHAKEIEDAKTFGIIRREVAPSGMGMPFMPWRSNYRRPGMGGMGGMSMGGGMGGEEGME